MWMLAAVMGALAASSAINFDWGRAADDDDDSAPAPVEGESEGAGQGDLLDFADRDAWLDGWTDDEHARSDAPAATSLPELRLSGMPVESLPPPNEEGAERDPWLDGWTDDEYVSSDQPASDQPAPLANPAIRLGGGVPSLSFVERG